MFVFSLLFGTSIRDLEVEEQNVAWTLSSQNGEQKFRQAMVLLWLSVTLIALPASGQIAFRQTSNFVDDFHFRFCRTKSKKLDQKISDFIRRPVLNDQIEIPVQDCLEKLWNLVWVEISIFCEPLNQGVAEPGAESCAVCSAGSLAECKLKTNKDISWKQAWAYLPFLRAYFGYAYFRNWIMQRKYYQYLRIS